MSLARRIPLLVCLTLALTATPALAQSAVQGDLQSQMSAEQFKAAGLDKLSASELAALNNWLQGKVAKEAAVVVEQAKEAGRQEIIVKNRGFFDFGSKEPIESSIVGEFKGFSKGRVYFGQWPGMGTDRCSQLVGRAQGCPESENQAGRSRRVVSADRGLQHPGQGAADQVGLAYCGTARAIGERAGSAHDVRQLPL